MSLLLPLLTSHAALAEAPIALAGEPFLAYPTDTIQLNGSASYDPDGDAITWSWVQLGGPPVLMQDVNTATPTFTVEAPGLHSFELTVSDPLEASIPDVVDVIVVEPEMGERFGKEGGCSALAQLPSLTLALVGVLALSHRRC